jgi:hypothetical protein
MTIRAIVLVVICPIQEPLSLSCDTLEKSLKKLAQPELRRSAGESRRMIKRALKTAMEIFAKNTLIAYRKAKYKLQNKVAAKSKRS